MSHVKTKNEKIQYLEKISNKFESGTKEYKEGYNHFTGDVTKMKECPYEYHCDTTGKNHSDWCSGFHDAYYAGVVEKDLKEDKPVTFRQVLELPRKFDKGDSEIMNLVYHNMLDIEDYGTWCGDDTFAHIDVGVVFYDNGDGERTKTIGVLSFDGIDVMAYNHAGRGSFEYNNTFIFNNEVYNQMLLYIRSVLFEANNDVPVKDVDLDDDAEHLINFYGSRLEIAE